MHGLGPQRRKVLLLPQCSKFIISSFNGGNQKHFTTTPQQLLSVVELCLHGKQCSRVELDAPHSEIPSALQKRWFIFATFLCLQLFRCSYFFCPMGGGNLDNVFD